MRLAIPCTSIVKTRQGNWWHHLPAYSRSEQGIAPSTGGVPCWRGWGSVSTHALLDADFHHYMAVCLVLTIDVYGYTTIVANLWNALLCFYSHSRTKFKC